MEYYRERYNAVLFKAVKNASTPSNAPKEAFRDAVHRRKERPAKIVDIESADVKKAIDALKKTARTTDFSATFLTTIRPAEIDIVTTQFNRWIAEGIPEKHALSWIFLIRKIGHKRTSAAGYRPIAIMPLMVKLLHVCLYLKMNHTCQQIIREQNFQFGCGRPDATLEIFQRAQDWLDADDGDDDDHAVVIADIEAAYDSVPHTQLLNVVRCSLGETWANTLEPVVRSQLFTLTTHEGFTPAMLPQQGLLQGSPLSVVLYLLYTATPPKITSSYCKAYVDDLTVLLKWSQIAQHVQRLNEWLREKHFRMAKAKFKIVARRQRSLQVPGLGCTATVTQARLLGGCLHAEKTVTACKRNDGKVERFSRACALVRQSYFQSTRRKADLFRSHALPTLSAHVLSRCFQPDHWKLNAAYNSLVPTHRNSKGVRDYTASGIGFRLTRISDYCDAQRTRAHIAARPHTRSQQLPARDFQLRPVRTGAKPKILADLECALQRATGQVVEIATDGSFREEAQVGAVGVYLNGKAYGAKIVGKICSSTQAELCAIALVATAIANTSSPLLRKWWCDSKSAIARAASARRGDPLAVVLKDAPEITWAKGHAQNMAINAADAAATAAYKTRSRYDLEWSYHAAGITHVCAHEEEDYVQMDEPGRFVRKTREHIRDTGLRRRLLQDGTPAALLNPRILAGLRKCHGATDILQALVRRAIMPRHTRRQCTVPGCQQPGNADHVLTANDAAHLQSFSEPAGLESIYGREPKLNDVLTEFSRCNKAAMRSVCERIRVQESEDKAAEWANWLRSELSTR
ncbi:hypothetical protein DIPPA_13405 [Diplonema papillatum]|nr:hypothetical protein DIPPA_13405 [Diplonema papillatum]